jgi:hypothetical protein
MIVSLLFHGLKPGYLVWWWLVLESLCHLSPWCFGILCFKLQNRFKPLIIVVLVKKKNVSSDNNALVPIGNLLLKKTVYSILFFKFAIINDLCKPLYGIPILKRKGFSSWRLKLD